jgi:DNA-binding NtrC family response regulator
MKPLKKIIVVDDVAEYVDSLARALSLQYDVVKAYSLQEAKKKMDSSIQLALVDVRLSEEDFTNRDGLIFLSWVKENFPDTPVLMMSAYRDFEAAVEAMNLGASYFIKKPINLKELRELIEKYIKG